MNIYYIYMYYLVFITKKRKNMREGGFENKIKNLEKENLKKIIKKIIKL